MIHEDCSRCEDLAEQVDELRGLVAEIEDELDAANAECALLNNIVKQSRLLALGVVAELER